MASSTTRMYLFGFSSPLSEYKFEKITMITDKFFLKSKFDQIKITQVLKTPLKHKLLSLRMFMNKMTLHKGYYPQNVHSVRERTDRGP